MRIIVLGSAAGGGFPQWNCPCAICRLAWAGDPRVDRAASRPSRRRPTARAGSCSTPRPTCAPRSSPPRRCTARAHGRRQPDRGRAAHQWRRRPRRRPADAAREAAASTFTARAASFDVLAANPLFGVLDPAVVARGRSCSDEPSPSRGRARGRDLRGARQGAALSGGGRGRRSARRARDGRRRLSATAARAPSTLPGCAAVTRRLRERVRGRRRAALRRHGVPRRRDDRGAASARRPAGAWAISPMSGDGGSLARLRRISASAGGSSSTSTTPTRSWSRARRSGAAVEAAGWEVAHDGMEIEL